jgi:type II secretory pathway pseudopilin PulG
MGSLPGSRSVHHRAQGDRSIALRRAFSLVELIVVMGVAVLLMGLLMPAMSQVRENAHKIVCSSNQRQLGQAIYTYAGANKEKLPYASALHMPGGQEPRPENLMAVRGPVHSNLNPNGWDGLGLLAFHGYCSAGQCFYCPSHHGNHPFERYQSQWRLEAAPAVIFSNFHYSGDVNWVNGEKRSLHQPSSTMVLATDGLKTSQDFNHETGMNVLRGDGSVIWRDNAERVVSRLPVDESVGIDTGYHSLWNTEIEIH